MDVTGKRQLFVDDVPVASKTVAAFRLHAPEPRNVALRFTEAWEGAESIYVTVLQDGDTFRMYYRGLKLSDSTNYRTCLAESANGINWQRTIGTYEASTNVVWRDALETPSNLGVGENFCPFIDTKPGVDASVRYKAIGGVGGLYGLTSPDGVAWTLTSSTKIISTSTFGQGKFDSHNVAFYDNVRGKYVCYFRSAWGGLRTITYADATNFTGPWGNAQLLPMTPTPPTEHIYNQPTVPCPTNSDLLIGLPNRYTGSNASGVYTAGANGTRLVSGAAFGLSEAHYMSSRDGLNFDRDFPLPWLVPGREDRDWTARSCMVAQGILATAPGEWSIFAVMRYGLSDVFVRRFVVREDGFVSLRADGTQGEVLGQLVTWTAGSAVLVNYATSPVNGYCKVALLDNVGAAIVGYDEVELYGDETDRVLPWDMAALIGTTVQFRFRLLEADLYSYEII